MITINLLPEEFRVQPKSETKTPYLKIAAAAGAIFIAVTLYLYIDFLFAKGELKKVQAEWAKIQPQSADLKKLEEEVEKTLKPEKVFLQSFVTAQKPLTFFLQWASEYLQDGMWLTEFQMERKQESGQVFIKGYSVPTKEKSSIESIEIYLHKLKEKIPDANLSLTTTRQTIEETEVTQFTANFSWGGQPKS